MYCRTCGSRCVDSYTCSRTGRRWIVCWACGADDDEIATNAYATAFWVSAIVLCGLTVLAVAKVLEG